MKSLLFSISLVLLCARSAFAVGLTPTAGPTLSHALNLVTNGSFETGHPDGINDYYWTPATIFTPAAPPGSPPGWTATASTSAYGIWGKSDSIVLNAAPPSDGNVDLYFGNGIVASIDQTPTFQSNGLVTFPITPNIVSKYGAPVTLSQTISGLTPSASYNLSFWVTGESEFAPEFSQDGIFAVDLTGYSTTFLTVPYNVSSPVGPAHTYFFNFTAAAPSVTLTFTNWGHFFSSTPGWSLPNSTELILDDVIINPADSTPEPGTAFFLFSGLALLLRPNRSSRRL